MLTTLVATVAFIIGHQIGDSIIAVTANPVYDKYLFVRKLLCCSLGHLIMSNHSNNCFYLMFDILHTKEKYFSKKSRVG